MATFKELNPADVKSARSFLNQLIDVIQEDISGSSSRRKYQVFVTGGVGPGVTSSLFQTVYDQNYTLQTANPVLDLSVGLYVSGNTVTGSSTGIDSAGKLLFPSNSLMMREKVDVYRQFAQTLLGDADFQFVSPVRSTTVSDQINEAMFIGFRRLFSRDAIKRETFAMKFYQSAAYYPTSGEAKDDLPNISVTSESGSAIYTDVGSSQNKEQEQGGAVGNIVDSSDTSRTVGLLFYDRGCAVFDLNKILSGSQVCSGTIAAMTDNTFEGACATGETIIGTSSGRTGNDSATFIPDFLVSASIDNVLDHLASTRFSSGSLTAVTFQNVTNINSTLFFCRASADEFNYSSNPTYANKTSGLLNVYSDADADGGTESPFSFVTSVGLYDANNNLLAIAKLSRPIEKNGEKDLTFRVRLDF